MSDFMELAGKLSAEVLAIRSDYQDVLYAIAAAKKEKIEAKERYNRCIDSGSEIGLKDCLRVIKRANEKVESLPVSRDSFFGKLGELENQRKVVMEAARRNVKEVEDNLAEVQKNLKKAKEESTHCERLLSELNSLRSLIIESGEVKSVSEDNDQI